MPTFAFFTLVNPKQNPSLLFISAFCFYCIFDCDMDNLVRAIHTTSHELTNYSEFIIIVVHYCSFKGLCVGYF